MEVCTVTQRVVCVCTADMVRLVKSLLLSLVSHSETRAQILGPNGPVIQTVSNRQAGLKASFLAVILCTDKKLQGFFCWKTSFGKVILSGPGHFYWKEIKESIAELKNAVFYAVSISVKLDT